MRSFGCTPSGVVTRSCTLGHTTSDYSGDLVRDHRILEGPHLEMHGQRCKLFMFRVISFFLFPHHQRRAEAISTRQPKYNNRVGVKPTCQVLVEECLT